MCHQFFLHRLFITYVPLVTAKISKTHQMASTIIAQSFAQFIPELTSALHKGSCGRIGIVGGSPEYTGAPYYAAISSLKFGADLTYVFCAEQAASAIKSYSPELMVVPVYDQIKVEATDDATTMFTRVTQSFSRLHALVLGPGLGRHSQILNATARIIAQAKEEELITILDADALFLLQSKQMLAVIQNNPRVILTPNIVEYRRLHACAIQHFEEEKQGKKNTRTKYTIGSAKDVEFLAHLLGGVCIVLKGENDVISNGTLTLMTDEIGGKKRSGGQGDVLAGCIATACCWTRASIESFPHAIFAACSIVKRASRFAFNKKFRSMTAPDVIQHLGQAFQSMFPIPKIGEENKNSK